MNDDPAPDVNDQTADWARPFHVRHINRLDELADRGMDISRDIASLAQAAETVEAAQACAVAYGQVAKAIRVTLMLQAKFIKELLAYDRNGAYRITAAADERKARVQRIVERVIDAEADDPDHAERLVEDAADRLDHDDIYGDVLSKPVSELVAMICKDLGVSPDWPLLAEEAWAREEMAGDAIGWPLLDPALERFKHEDHEEAHEGHKESTGFVTFVPPS